MEVAVGGCRQQGEHRAEGKKKPPGVGMDCKVVE